MKTILIYILTALFISASIICCSDRPTQPIENSRYFRIKVDAISVQPGIINQSDTLIIRFSGTVGSTSCFKFSHFQGSNSLLRTDLALWGEEKYGSGVSCNEGNVPLEAIFRVFPLIQGIHKIIVYQPDGSELVEEVVIN